MGQVWIAIGGWAYEGFEVISVWDSEDAAIAAADAVKSAYDYVDVLNHVVESQAQQQ